MPAPVYISRVSSEGIGQLEPTRAPMGEMTGQAMARFGQALGGLGSQVFNVSQQIEQVNRATTLAERETQFLTKIDGLNEEFRNDQDPATAEQRFQAKAQELRGQALNGLRQEDQAELGLKLQRKVIAYNGEVRTGALKRQADTYGASVDQQYDVLTKKYANAASDAERQAIAGELDDTLKSGIARGMLTAKGAEAYRQSLVKTGDTALLLRQIGQNPAAAEAALKDPEKFKGLDAVQREQLMGQARAAAEERAIAANVQRARFDPAGAAFAVGRVTSPQQAAAIFDKAFIPQESSGNPNAQSVDGAAGIAQIMPGTAKDLIKRIGGGNWDNLSDAEIQKKLKENPAQTRAMGIRYFQDNITRFNGNLAPAIAAYHAGPGGQVAAAHEKAVAAHGPAYTPEQFLAFLPQTLKDGNGKTTASYVADIYRRMNAPLNAMGLSAGSSFRASNAVGAELDRQLAEQKQMIGQLTSVASQQADQFAQLYQKGYAVDPARVAAIEGPLLLGAARGDASAQSALQRLNFARELAPIVQEAYRMRPEQVEAGVAQMRQQMATTGATPEMAKRLQVFESVASEMATARKDNPIALAERQGMQATAIDVQATPQSPEFGRALLARSVISDKAFEAYRGTQQFFRPEERMAIKARFEGMGDTERFDLLRSLKQNTTSEGAFRAAVTEITGGDKLAATAGMFMMTNEGLARDILRGSAIAQLDGIKPKAEEVKQALKSAMPGLLYPPNVQGQLIDAALAVYAAERGKNATLYDAADRAGLEAAMERVTGKMVKINGRKVPMPPSVTPAVAQDTMWSLTADTLNAFGGAFGRNNVPLDARLISRHAHLRPLDVQGGRFAVILPDGRDGAPVMTRDGKPLVIDLPKAVAMQRTQERPGTQWQQGRARAFEQRVMPAGIDPRPDAGATP